MALRDFQAVHTPLVGLLVASAVFGVVCLADSTALAQPRPGDPGTVGALIRPGQPGFTIVEVHTDEIRITPQPVSNQYHRQVEFEDCVRLTQRGDECRWEQEGTVSRWGAEAMRRWRKVYRWQVNLDLAWWYGCEFEGKGSGFDDGLVVAGGVGAAATVLSGVGTATAIMDTAATGCWMAEVAGSSGATTVAAGSAAAVAGAAVVGWELGGHLEAALTDCEAEAWELQTPHGVWVFDDIDWGPAAYPDDEWVEDTYTRPYFTTPWTRGAWGFVSSLIYRELQQIDAGYAFDFPLGDWQSCAGIPSWEGSQRAGRWIIDTWTGATIDPATGTLADGSLSRPEPAAYFPPGFDPPINLRLEEDRFPVSRWTNQCDGEARRVPLEDAAIADPQQRRSAPEQRVDDGAETATEPSGVDEAPTQRQELDSDPGDKDAALLTMELATRV